ncbi:MAG TPA: SGNH/GDSL hydrolase family protein, partial [Rhizomicrobium sp.]|nr:SGNH/GDSL hydrolase family protein [Rhizomicrobium sp.]
SMTNYDIEMWRYAKELKVRSDDPLIAFEHVRNSSALLQSVTIRTNEWGLRGGPVAPRDPNLRRILVLGGSITLGWGVPEDKVMTSRLEQMFAADDQHVEVLNGGVGNYNAVRYVERFFKRLEGLQPSDIVVHYFLRDAEDLDPGGGNFLLRHSEVAVTAWIAAHRLFDHNGERSLIDHYRAVYNPEAPGFKAMLSALDRLRDYAAANHIKVYFAMVPDVHNLVNYPFGFIHEMMRGVAERDHFIYVDLLPGLTGLEPEQLWAMPGDPHPNALGHQIMAQSLYPVLKGQ